MSYGTPVDSLKVGDYVAMVGSENAPPNAEFCGLPCKILSISLPFLAVECNGRTFALDVRPNQVQRVSKHYANAMAGAGRRRRTKRVAEHTRCVRCGERMVERRDADTRTWVPTCPKCGAEGAVQ